MTAHLDALRTLYHPAYHETKHPPSLAAARGILPMVFDLLRVRSVVDVGCGTGSWLAAAAELGATRLVGVEGDWATAWERHGVLGREDVTLVLQNLEEPLRVEGVFDLAIAVEIAEHLSPARAASFVTDLCRLSRRVLFSAATPGQGGFNHLNEQWQSWWAARFAAHGFSAIDLIRPRIWGVDTVPYWYRQNILLYLHEEELDDVRQRADVRPPGLLDVVHPGLFAYKLEQLREAEERAATLGAPAAGTQAGGAPRAPAAVTVYARAARWLRRCALRVRKLADRLPAWVRRRLG